MRTVYKTQKSCHVTEWDYFLRAWLGLGKELYVWYKGFTDMF
jgi:hypothetical protein